MFQRFSEPVRRVVFFARQEASRLGGTSITTEHLLLGFLGENAWLVEPLLAPGHTVQALRSEIERAAGSSEKKLPTSAEMPLTEPAKMALTYADEESNRLQSSTIDAPHLLLGILRTPGKAAGILTQFGLNADDLRVKVAGQELSPVQEPFGVISAFYGIEIRIDARAEAVPRIIAEHRGRVAVIEVDPVKLIQSNLPARAQSMILEWMDLHKDEITVAWKAAKAGKRPPPIPPLE